MDEFSKIPEMLYSISGTLNSRAMSELRKTSRQFQKSSESSELWLNNIQTRFGLSLSNSAVYDMMLRFLETGLIRYANVTLWDDTVPEGYDAVTVLGKMVISAADTIGSIIHKLDSRFGILGDVAICRVYDADDFTSERYITVENRVEYQQCTQNYVAIDTDGYLLYHDGKIDSYWFKYTIQDVIPQAFRWNPTEIVFITHEYPEPLLAEIRNNIAEALEN